jgi:hypothetical protein
VPDILYTPFHLIFTMRWVSLPCTDEVKAYRDLVKVAKVVSKLHYDL